MGGVVMAKSKEQIFEDALDTATNEARLIDGRWPSVSPPEVIMETAQYIAALELRACGQ